MEERFSKYLWLYLPLLVVFVLDRIAKNLAQIYLETKTIVLIPKVLVLHAVSNEGVAFGIFSSHGQILILLISIILLIALFSIHSIPRKYYLPMGLILGGAFGNVFDRFLYSQGVIDFISVPFFSIFNVADIAITCGIIILIIGIFLSETRDAARRNKSRRGKRA